MKENTFAKNHLAGTACWTAAARAHESEREDRLFDDPYASALAGEEGAHWLASQAGSAIGFTPMIIRTRYFDDFLRDAAFQCGIRQVVNLAAGLDTRAFRLQWPAGTRLFELDMAGVIAYKDQVLHAAEARPSCDRRTITGDLTGPWDEALAAGGFDARQPAAWLIEGTLFYLPDENIVRLIDQISGLSTPGSRLGFDIVNDVTLKSPYTRAWIEMQAQQGAPWLGAMEDPEAFLSERGWQVYLTQPGAPDADYGRWSLPVIPVRAPGLPHSWFVTGTRK